MSDERISIEIDAGTVIFHAGEAGDHAYYLDSGLVEIVAAGEPEVVIATRTPGELFGEMAIIDGGLRSATARAKTPCRLTRLSATSISREFGKSDPLMRAIMTTMLARLREQSRAPLRTADERAPDRQVEMLLAMAKIRAEQDLERAIRRREITLFYQPIVDLGSGEVSGYEALARWQHPQRGLVSPAEFIPLAENSGLIGRLTQSCLEQAAASLPLLGEAARRSGLRIPYVNVNVSGFDLVETDFAERLERLTGGNGVNGRLRIEITESALMDRPEEALRQLQATRDLGVGIAIDDFGTGYSSLAYLHRLPVDVLKIDRSFIQSMDTNPQSAKIVTTIVRMADSLELPVVSEGLETSTDVAAVTGIGCEYGQGYHFARPMDLSALAAFMTDWRRRTLAA